MTIKEKNPNVLLVDDEKTIVQLLEPIITNYGYNVTSYTDSKKAIEAIRTNHYDVVLTDLMMPDVTGMDISKEIKASGKDTKVIILTGFASVDSAIESIQLGIYDYLRKPLKLDEIKIVVKRAINQLILERENHTLNKQVQKMLADITMLNDVSSILYQVADFESALNMVIDTMVEGMNTENVALFTDDKHRGVFSSKVSRGLDNIDFEFHSDLKINNELISLTEMTEINNCKGKLVIGDHEISFEKNIEQIFFIPVRYFDDTLAFIVVFQQKNETLNASEIKLFTILATQIAPVFANRTYFYTGGELGCEKFIESKIKQANSINGTVTFALLSLKGESDMDFSQLSQKFDDIIHEETKELESDVWKGVNSWLIAAINTDTITLEISCAGIRQKIEDINENEKSNKISIQLAIEPYPRNGQDIDLYNRLSERNFNETNIDATLLSESIVENN